MAGTKPTRRTEQFGKRLKELRLEQDRTQEQMALQLLRRGVKANRSYVKKWEDGRVPPPDVIWAYEQAFGLEQGNLLGAIYSELVAQDFRVAADESVGPLDNSKAALPMAQDDAAVLAKTALTGIFDSFANYPPDLRETFIRRADAIAYELKRAWNEQQERLGKTADQRDG